MSETFTKIWAFIRHNSGICIGSVLGICFLLWSFSCQSSVVSLVDPQVQVTRIELLAEVDMFLARAESRLVDLDRQDLVRDTVFNSIGEILATGTINPAAVFLALGNILGLGAVIDNVRKRTHIATLRSDMEKITAVKTA
ncbi:hypothetical protein ES703_40385 [subsurface metagenome]